MTHRQAWSMGCLALIASLALPFSAQAGQTKAEQVFCKVARSIDTPNTTLKDEVAVVLATSNLLKGFLAAYYIVDVERSKAAYYTAELQNTVTAIDKSRLAKGAAKLFIRSFIPSLSLLQKTLKKPDEWWKWRHGTTYLIKSQPGVDLHNTNFMKFYKFYVKFNTALNTLGASILAVRMAALGVCKKTLLVVPVCTRQKKQCRLPIYHDLPSGMPDTQDAPRACTAQQDAAKVSTLQQLTSKHETNLLAMATQMKRAAIVFHKLAPIMKQLKPVISGLQKATKSVKKVVKGIGVTLKPMGLASKEMNKLLEKKMCIVKGKCTRMKNIVKKMGKYAGKITKPVEKKIDKLVKPVLNKILKKLPIPNLKALQKPVTKAFGSLDKLGGLLKEFNIINKLPLTKYKTTLETIQKGLPTP